MRLVFVVHGWYLGGFVTFCRNLSAGLRNRGHEVALLVLPDSPLKQAVPEGLFDHVSVLPRGLCRLALHVKRVVQEVNRLHPEVLVLNDSPYAMAALPFLAPDLIRTPVVHSVESNEVELGLSNSPWWDRLLAVSGSVAHALTNKGCGSRISLCRLGVPLPALARQPRQGSAPHPLRLITVGRIVTYQKRMDRLPAIAGQLAQRGVNFQWTVLGDGTYLPRLRRELNRLGLTQRFRFPGRVSPPAVSDALAEADVFVMPSDCEGMPQALLEAMAHGLVPVVARIAGSTTDLVQEPQCGYLCGPADTAAYAGAVAELASAPARRRAMGLRAAEFVAKNFSLNAFTDRFLSVVREVQTQDFKRAAPLPMSAFAPGPRTFRCLGFWRSLKHQSLGQLKRWLLKRACGGVRRAYSARVNPSPDPA